MKGFSLLETLITLAIMSIGIVSFNLATNSIYQASGQHQQQATTLHKSQIIQSLELIFDDESPINLESCSQTHRPNCTNNNYCNAQQLIEYHASQFCNQ